MERLPLALRQVLESGDCVLFIGAGVGSHLKRPDGSAAPDGAKLATDLCTHFGVTPASTDLARVAELVEIRKTRTQLINFVKRSLDVEPDETFQWLATFKWRAIFTTNYDRAIERAYELNPNPHQSPVSMSATSDLKYTDPRVEIPIFHLHGALFGPQASHIVITQTDYARFKDKRQMLWSRLKTEFATSTLFYVGYSGRDPNWQLVLDELTQEFYPSELPQSFRLDPFPDELDVELLKNRHIETLKGNLGEFRDQTVAERVEFRPDPEFLGRYKRDVPRDLVDAFDANPVALLRLLTSWQYVNGLDFRETPNTAQFLKGDKPNWSLVGANIPFKRDLEDELWEDVLEFATTPNAKSRALAMIGPAGYGTTTLLMGVAAKVVSERIGPVFILRESAVVLEGDMQYAATLFPDVTCFFVIDQAREHAPSLNASLLQLRQSEKSCLFLLGERKNEWRMARPRMNVKEFELLPLSDLEIERLLNYLSTEKALGRLEELDRNFQFNIVKQRHEKQLLVTMREVTEGEGFDRIIENEYRGIGDKNGADSSTARALYLLISCFYQQGVMIRDKLLADIMGKALPLLYSEIGEALEGLVTFEETDIARGEYAARTRHRIIAEIVWKKCGVPTEREGILLAAMERLNLSYRLDKNIFDKFVRSDEIVESIRTLENKTKFFETACKREPTNPYVLQHFARMLLREQKLTLALAQIDSALKMDNANLVFHHTRGAILAASALAAEKEDLGQKWLLQSEKELMHGIDANPRDDYFYQTLAQLYLDWAKRLEDEAEASEYIKKCEATISRGLRMVRDRDALWIISADVQKYLGNQPARIQKLKRAVEESGTDVVARYLLGRLYRQQGEHQQTITVLDSVVRSQFSEFRSFVEYVRAMLQLNEPYSKCIAVLSQARLDGITDPSYVGLLGGLYVMNGELKEALRTFEEAEKQEFGYEEKKRIQFRPSDPVTHSRPRVVGTIVTVKPSYVFIRADRYPDVISHMTKVGQTTLQRGTRVTFEPAFSARGCIGENLKLQTA